LIESRRKSSYERPARFEHLASKLGDRWFAVQAFRIGDPDALRVAVLFSDITDRKTRDELKRKAEETQTLLNHELSHRMKNMFSLVQAIANQTLRDVEERDLIHAFNERIRALSRAHDVLLKQSWAAAELGAKRGNYGKPGQEPNRHTNVLALGDVTLLLRILLLFRRRRMLLTGLVLASACHLISPPSLCTPCRGWFSLTLLTCWGLPSFR